MSGPVNAGAVLPRSFLYVPAVRPDLFDKAHQGGADAIVLDLEDAVPLHAKAEARLAVSRWLEEVRGRPGAQVWVRVDPTFLVEDLDAAIHPAVSGLFAAKATADALQRLHALAGPLEETRGVPESVGIVALVETAATLLRLADLAGQRRLRTFGIGEVDLLADLRMRRTPGTQAAVDALRLDVVRQAAASGLEAPVAPTSTDFRDLESFAATTRHLVDLGFRSRTAVHPAQVEVINQMLAPDPEELERARRLVALDEAAGGGITVDDSGRLVDAAVLREARETLSRA